MSEYKFKNMWCVFNPENEPVLYTLRNSSDEAIEVFVKPLATKEFFEKSNYTCKKVNVKIEKV